MGCIGVSVKKIGGSGAGTSRIGGINSSIQKMGGISASVLWKGGIGVTVSLVCTVHKKVYLTITPVETQWIDVDFSIKYNIESNTNWNIV